MNATRRKTRDEVGLLGEDSAARIKRTLTVVPNAPVDLYIPVPGCTFKGGNLIIIDYLRCQLWPINVFVFFSFKKNRKGHRQWKQIPFQATKKIIGFFCFFYLRCVLQWTISSACLIRVYGNILYVNSTHTLWWTAAAVADGLAFTGDGLKFTFDLSLPGKRASRKSPNARKVRTKTHRYRHHHISI